MEDTRGPGQKGMELGVFTFGETHIDPATGRQLDAGTRLRHLLEEVKLADEVGLDVFGFGEHHRADYTISAPTVVMGAAAAVTERIRLTTAVSVLSSDDPVRVFQQHATADRISGGRVEMIAGRGSFTESFPLFGYALDDYPELFTEKLDLMLELREPGTGRSSRGPATPDGGEGTGGGVAERITWQGSHRPSIPGRGVYPRPEQEPMPLWIAVGGTPQSVVRAANLGLPLAVAIIGGTSPRFKPLVELYREAWEKAGHDPAHARVSINGHGFLADDAGQARRIALPPFAETMSRIGQERGWGPVPPQALERETDLHGALFMGSAQEVIDKIMFQWELFRHHRTLIQLTVGPIEHDRVLRAIEIVGTEVAPVIRRETAQAPKPAQVAPG